jgi:hypothetical protein
MKNEELDPDWTLPPPTRMRASCPCDCNCHKWRMSHIRACCDNSGRLWRDGEFKPWDYKE